MVQRRCIYCLDFKPTTEFNREHVVPQAFGVFESNLVIDCTCKECNQHFGNTIDLKLARDTIEGVDRVRAGLKKGAEFKGVGAKSTMEIRYAEGPLRGALGYHVPGPDGGLAVEPIAQAGFAKSASDEPTWFPLDQAPTKEKLSELGYGKGTAIYVQGVDMAAAAKVLAEKGWVIKEISEIQTQGVDRGEIDATVARLAQAGIGVAKVIETPLLSGPIDTRVITTIARPEFRALTKIALNYVACVAGAAYGCLPHFNEARRFARNDVEPSDKLVLGVAENRWEVVPQAGQSGPVEGHYISCHHDAEGMIVQICLLMKLRYVLRLGGAFTVVTPGSAHFFNLSTGKVQKLPPLPLTPPRGFLLTASDR